MGRQEGGFIFLLQGGERTLCFRREEGEYITQNVTIKSPQKTVYVGKKF